MESMEKTNPEGVQGAGDTEKTCCCRKKLRPEKEYRDLLNRLSRIEGQIRGLKGMVERDAYCIDILNQASAASSALSSFCKVATSAPVSQRMSAREMTRRSMNWLRPCRK